jgi:hypothetical protein
MAGTQEKERLRVLFFVEAAASILLQQPPISFFCKTVPLLSHARLLQEGPCNGACQPCYGPLLLTTKTNCVCPLSCHPSKSGCQHRCRCWRSDSAVSRARDQPEWMELTMKLDCSRTCYDRGIAIACHWQWLLQRCIEGSNTLSAHTRTCACR